MKFFIYTFLLVFFTGCVSKVDYPRNWSEPNPEIKNECPDISGIYNNIGEVTTSDYKPKLNDILFANSNEATSVKLELDNISLNIKLLFDKKVVSEKSINFRDENISCKNSFLIIEDDENINRGGTLAKEWKTIYLTKNANGLVIKRKNSALGLIFLVPIVGSDTDWILFQNKNL